MEFLTHTLLTNIVKQDLCGIALYKEEDKNITNNDTERDGNVEIHRHIPGNGGNV